MTLIHEAYMRLFDTHEFPYSEVLTYSGHFKGYNANVQLRGKKIEFKLSKKWKGVSRDIQIGCIQELFVKLLKKRGRKIPKTTLYIELYHYFLRSVHRTIPKTLSDPILENHFNIINDTYFLGILEQPNLKWGSFSLHTIGYYDFGTDTITMSKALHPAVDCPEELLCYVLYHEMLHKKHKFKGSHGRTYSHTKAFREDEKKFDQQILREKQLGKFLSMQRRRKRLLNFF